MRRALRPLTRPLPQPLQLEQLRHQLAAQAERARLIALGEPSGAQLALAHEREPGGRAEARRRVQQVEARLVLVEVDEEALREAAAGREQLLRELGAQLQLADAVGAFGVAAHARVIACSLRKKVSGI